jgi:hypothetical protein
VTKGGSAGVTAEVVLDNKKRRHHVGQRLSDVASPAA